MTARHQIRIGTRRLGRDRTAINATPAPALGEMLQLARERKGVDLFRAERDTKIRLKYLAALEDSNHAELPAPVYTKGFLRNYAIYLGLDPEEVLERWREELQLGRPADRPAMAPPPRPIATPSRHVTISPGLLMSGLVLLAVVGFVAFIAVQMTRFLETPGVSLTNPPTRVSVVDADNVTLEGRSGAGALVTIHAPDGQLHTTTADETGRWSREVPLGKGRNDFTVVANDPVTRRDSPLLHIVVSVPLPDGSPRASASPATPQELRLTLLQPSDGTTSDSSEVTVSGTTTGTRVTIESTYLGPLDGGAASPLPTAPPSPSLPASPSASTDPDAGPRTDVTVAETGSFSGVVTLNAGRWEISVTAYSSGLQPVSETRTIAVRPSQALVLEIEAERGDSWLRIQPDGAPLRGWGGPTLRRGSSVTVTASEEIYLRTGNAGSIRITLNGVDLGFLGKKGEVGTWLFRPGAEPERMEQP